MADMEPHLVARPLALYQQSPSPASSTRSCTTLQHIPTSPISRNSLVIRKISIDSPPTPIQGAVIALSIVCGLLIFGIFLYMMLYYSHKHHIPTETTANIRILSSRRPRRLRRGMMGRNRGRGGHEQINEHEQLEYPVESIGRGGGFGRGHMRGGGGYAPTLHPNSQIAGLYGHGHGQPEAGFYGQPPEGDGQGNPLQQQTQMPQAYFGDGQYSQHAQGGMAPSSNRPVRDRGDEDAEDRLGDLGMDGGRGMDGVRGLRRTQGPIRGSPNLGSIHSSRMGGDLGGLGT